MRIPIIARAHVYVRVCDLARYCGSAALLGDSEYWGVEFLVNDILKRNSGIESRFTVLNIVFYFKIFLKRIVYKCTTKYKYC